GNAAAPNRQAADQYAGAVADDAVGDERRDIALLHARAQDVAENAGARHAHGVGYHDGAFRHVLDGGAGGDRTAPALRRRDIFAHRDETQRKSSSDGAAAAWNQRLWTVHPAAADAPLQEHRPDRR